MDRLGQRLVSTPSAQASGSRSTTPTYEPGARPSAGPAGPPPISPALPPLEQNEEVPPVSLAGGSRGGSGNSGEGEWSFLSLPILGSVSRFCSYLYRGRQVSSPFKQNIKNIIKQVKTIKLLTPVLLHYTTHLNHITITLVVTADKHASLRCATLHRRK